MKHIASFVRAPIGYLVAVVASLTQYTGSPMWFDRPLCAACEMFCVKDGVQDDPLF